MRFLRIFTTFVVLVTAASAAELKIKVIDPQSAAVARARVELYLKDTATLITIETTSREGLATFHPTASAAYRLRVLAPGFAEQISEVTSWTDEPLTVQVHIAPASQTVVVTATRSPVPSDSANASVATLSAAQLEVMQPVAANEAMRFLPGAVIGTQGRRGGLASLFVRGGDSRYNKVIVDGVPIDEPGGTFDFGVVPLAETDRLEFVRGAQSTLYGSDAMTSVVQTWTRAGSTPVPELRFGADGGNFDTAHGYLSLAGAHGPFDYNLFSDQFNTNGQSQRRIFKFAAGRESRSQPERAVALQVSAPQCLHWSAGGGISAAPRSCRRFGPVAAAKQSAQVSGTHGGRPVAMAASLHQLRVQSSAHERRYGRRPWPSV